MEISISKCQSIAQQGKQSPWPKESTPMDTPMFMAVFGNTFSWVINMAMFKVRKKFQGEHIYQHACYACKWFINSAGVHCHNQVIKQ